MRDRKRPAELVTIDAALTAVEDDAKRLVHGLSEALGGWRAAPGSWSVAECLDHLATSNRVYVDAMTPPAERARQAGRWRRHPPRPGVLGGWFVRSLEPGSATRKLPAPRKIRPRTAPALADAMRDFLTSQAQVREFLQAYGDLDLARIYFPNPFIRGLRWSLATGLHVIPAHERRHLAQAWRARHGAEAAAAA